MKKVTPTVKVGKQIVELKDFISAVLENIDNAVVHFNIRDSRYASVVNFTIEKKKIWED